MELMGPQLIVSSINVVVNSVRLVLYKLTGKKLKDETEDKLEIEQDYAGDDRMSIIMRNVSSEDIFVKNISAKSNGKSLCAETCPTIKLVSGECKNITFSSSAISYPVSVMVVYSANGRTLTEELDVEG